MAAATSSMTSAEVWRGHYMRPEGMRWWPCEALVRAVAGRRFGLAVEAGCGNGANLAFLAEHADRVVGVDGCAEALAVARHYMEERDTAVDLRQGSIFGLPLRDGEADAVVDVMVSQHVPWADRAALYAEYRRVLRPGGWLFLYHLGQGTTVGDAEPSGPWGAVDPALFPEAGLTVMPPADNLAAVVARAGFRIVSRERLTREYDGGSQAVYHVVQGEAA